MALSYITSLQPKPKIIEKVKKTLDQSLNYIRPETILALFVITAIILAFVQIQAIGFHIIFGIYIVCFFNERKQGIRQIKQELENFKKEKELEKAKNEDEKRKVFLRKLDKLDYEKEKTAVKQ